MDLTASHYPSCFRLPLLTLAWNHRLLIQSIVFKRFCFDHFMLCLQSVDLCSRVHTGCSNSQRSAAVCSLFNGAWWALVGKQYLTSAFFLHLLFDYPSMTFLTSITARILHTSLNIAPGEIWWFFAFSVFTLVSTSHFLQVKIKIVSLFHLFSYLFFWKKKQLSPVSFYFSVHPSL